MIQKTHCRAVSAKKKPHTADKSLQQTVQGHNGPTVKNQTLQETNQHDPASPDDNHDTKPTVAPPRKKECQCTTAPVVALPVDPTGTLEPPCTPKESGSKERGLVICVTSMYFSSGSTTSTHVRAVSSRRTPRSPTYIRELATGSSRASVSAACADQLEHGETGSTADSTGRHKESPRNPEDSQMQSTPPLLSGNAVRLWTCVASTNAAAVRGHAAQAAFDC